MLSSAIRAKPVKCGGASTIATTATNLTRLSPRPKAELFYVGGAGVAFGLLPCPSAMAAYFTSMSTGSPVAAYAVIGLFAAGIASSLTLVGMFVQRFGGNLLNSHSRLVSLPWPYLRAGLILSIGSIYVFRLVAA